MAAKLLTSKGLFTLLRLNWTGHFSLVQLRRCEQALTEPSTARWQRWHFSPKALYCTSVRVCHPEVHSRTAHTACVQPSAIVAVYHSLKILLDTSCDETDNKSSASC